MDWFKSTGTLVYEPHGRNEKTKNKVSAPWWLLLLCDNEILSYYNWFLVKKGIQLQKYSLYGSHISVVKGEEPPNKKIWNKYNHIKIEFEYCNLILNNETHWWVWGRSPFFGTIREELGLNPKPFEKFHLTIGRKQ